MNKDYIMKTDVLDIIFENRNKAYGAYDLRKFYAERLRKALAIMLMFVAAFSALLILSKKEDRLITRIFDFPPDTEMKKMKDAVKKQEIAKPQVKTNPVDQRRLSNNPLIVDNTAKVDTVQTLKPTDNIGTTNTFIPGAGPVLVQPKIDIGDAPAAPVVKIDKRLPLDLNAVDMPPAYPGGFEALKKFLERNLTNPTDLEEGETISVKVQFVVGYNGKLQSFVTVQDGGEAFNKEVIRVLKKMPEWIPGKSNGENVSVYYTIPVKFVPAN